MPEITISLVTHPAAGYDQRLLEPPVHIVWPEATTANQIKKGLGLDLTKQDYIVEQFLLPHEFTKDCPCCSCDLNTKRLGMLKPSEKEFFKPLTWKHHRVYHDIKNSRIKVRSGESFVVYGTGYRPASAEVKRNIITGRQKVKEETAEESLEEKRAKTTMLYFPE